MILNHQAALVPAKDERQGLSQGATKQAVQGHSEADHVKMQRNNGSNSVRGSRTSHKS